MLCLYLGALLTSGLSGTTAYLGMPYANTACHNDMMAYDGPYDVPVFALSFPIEIITSDSELEHFHEDVEAIISRQRFVPLDSECVINNECKNNSNGNVCTLGGKCGPNSDDYNFETRTSHFQYSHDAYNVKCYP